MNIRGKTIIRSFSNMSAVDPGWPAAAERSHALITNMAYSGDLQEYPAMGVNELRMLRQTNVPHMVSDNIMLMLTSFGDPYYNERLSQLFLHMRGERTGTLSMPHITATALDNLNIGTTDVQKLWVSCAAYLAEVINKCVYHGNDHFREVPLLAIAMIAKNRELYAPGDDQYLDDETAIKLVIAALIHDLAHDGMGNGDRGVAFLEMQSVDAYAQFAKHFGIPEDWIEDIRALNYVTDVASNGFDSSPAAKMREMHKGNEVPLDDNEKYLQRLKDEPKLLHAARILCTADLSPSAGLSKDMNVLMSMQVAAEMGQGMVATGGATKFFFDLICKPDLYDFDEARNLFGHVFESLKSWTEMRVRIAPNYNAHIGRQPV